LDVCHICLNGRIGQLYATPWKSIIIKNIDPSSRKIWDQVLGKYRINVRHAANELNWQVEDLSEEGLQLKRHIIRHFDKEDVRTYGLCFALQTKPSSSMFGSIIIQKQPAKNANQLKSLDRYNIFYKKKFNPNERELVLFREGVEKEHLSIYLVNLCKFFYEQDEIDIPLSQNDASCPAEKPHRIVYQCKNCLTVYDPMVGDEDQGVVKGTGFEQLPPDYLCPLCESGKEDFLETEETILSGSIFDGK
jgi:rubredoxin